MVFWVARQELFGIVGKVMLKASHDRCEVSGSPCFGFTSKRHRRFLLNLGKTNHFFEFEAGVFQIFDFFASIQIVPLEHLITLLALLKSHGDGKRRMKICR